MEIILLALLFHRRACIEQFIQSIASEPLLRHGVVTEIGIEKRDRNLTG